MGESRDGSGRGEGHSLDCDDPAGTPKADLFRGRAEGLSERGEVKDTPDKKEMTFPIQNFWTLLFVTFLCILLEGWWEHPYDWRLVGATILVRSGA